MFEFSSSLLFQLFLVLGVFRIPLSAASINIANDSPQERSCKGTYENFIGPKHRLSPCRARAVSRVESERGGCALVIHAESLLYCSVRLSMEIVERISNAVRLVCWLRGRAFAI